MIVILTRKPECRTPAPHNSTSALVSLIDSVNCEGWRLPSKFETNHLATGLPVGNARYAPPTARLTRVALHPSPVTDHSTRARARASDSDSSRISGYPDPKHTHTHTHTHRCDRPRVWKPGRTLPSKPDSGPEPVKHLLRRSTPNDNPMIY